MTDTPEKIDITSFMNAVTEKSARERIHTAIPAEVVSYDALKRTASVKPTIRKKDESGIVEYPVLQDVKVFFAGSGKWSVVHDLVAGDCGLVLFSELSVAEWITNGGIVTPASSRHHHLSDSFFLPLLRTDASLVAVVPFTGEGIQIGNDDGTISMRVDGSGVSVLGDLSVTGAIVATGDVTATGDVVGAGVSLKNHQHIAVAVDGTGLACVFTPVGKTGAPG